MNLLHKAVTSIIGPFSRRICSSWSATDSGFEHELLPLLDEVRKLHLDADRLERLVGAHAVLVAVEQAQLVDREVARLEQVLQLRHNAALHRLLLIQLRARLRDAA